MKIAVAGGTGKTGRLVVGGLTRDGHQPVVLARAEGVDLVQGHGLDDALRGSPQQRITELAGPRVESMVDMARRLIARRGQRRPVIPLRLPGHGFRSMANGALLPQEPGPRGIQTYEQWLATVTSTDAAPS